MSTYNDESKKVLRQPADEDAEVRNVVAAEKAARMNRSTAAGRKAVSIHLDDELGGRDEQRAARYVATVRPAMAAQRYGRHQGLGERTNERAKKYGLDAKDDATVPRAEDDGGRIDNERSAEEGDGPTDERQSEEGEVTCLQLQRTCRPK